jgi:hypothetical protein
MSKQIAHLVSSEFKCGNIEWHSKDKKVGKYLSVFEVAKNK